MGEAYTERGATSLATVLKEDPPFSFAPYMYTRCSASIVALPGMVRRNFLRSGISFDEQGVAASRVRPPACASAGATQSLLSTA